MSEVKDALADLQQNCARVEDIDEIRASQTERQSQSSTVQHSQPPVPTDTQRTQREEEEQHRSSPHVVFSNLGNQPAHRADTIGNTESAPLSQPTTRRSGADEPARQPNSATPSFMPFTPYLTSTPRGQALVTPATNMPTSASFITGLDDGRVKLKPNDFPKFGGKDEDIDRWIEQGDASKWLTTLSYAERSRLVTWQDWQDALRAEYRKANFETHKEEELRQRMWYRNESFAEYYTDRRSLQRDMMLGIPQSMQTLIKTATGQVLNKNLTITEWKRLVIDAEPGLIAQYVSGTETLLQRGVPVEYTVEFQS
ncbi:hypothetical protein PUNSTDRAFT_134938 [Punctularia strigosozonata HHB-11173 SS5]|uniref:uncharacterized protein n=1 Tax=Punctularia strigosozonata (strain HHB-11173) TaxID=741275 RepID=UPI0004416F75|nr:uncharacterized protein PUNSTDRAFT_134938 [Punctularia strigosozonata HHB-11173 SS5]EIN08564.1 hypothetical protein PUNSTDRAFT_134938 [Punctularia strigosozonata HHB-11173 SS5]